MNGVHIKCRVNGSAVCPLNEGRRSEGSGHGAPASDAGMVIIGQLRAASVTPSAGFPLVAIYFCVCVDWASARDGNVEDWDWGGKLIPAHKLIDHQPE
jgi:hypothetical protein